MKKTIILGIILLMILPQSFGMSDPGGNRKPKVIKSVEINADVTVVLGYYGSQQPFIDGEADFKDQIVIKQSGTHLVISATKNKNLKAKGVIYISAESLLELRINSSAFVQSSGTLNAPLLTVFINGLCEFMIANTGNLNIEAGLMYNIEYRNIPIRTLPFYLSKK